jgi:hypothetical protein
LTDIRRLQLTVIGVCQLVFGSLYAGETIATANWEYEAPQGWSIDVSAQPPKSVGPRNELVQFSSATLPALSEGGDARKTRAKVERLSLETINKGAISNGMKVTRPLSRTELTPQLVMYEVESRNSREKSILVSFVLLGPRAIVLVTYEAATPGLSLNEVRDALRRIKWAA